MLNLYTITYALPGATAEPPNLLAEDVTETTVFRKIENLVGNIDEDSFETAVTMAATRNMMRNLHRFAIGDSHEIVLRDIYGQVRYVTVTRVE